MNKRTDIYLREKSEEKLERDVSVKENDLVLLAHERVSNVTSKCER